jgi:hypothetical protein
LTQTASYGTSTTLQVQVWTYTPLPDVPESYPDLTFHLTLTGPNVDDYVELPNVPYGTILVVYNPNTSELADFPEIHWTNTVSTGPAMSFTPRSITVNGSLFYIFITPISLTAM